MPASTVESYLTIASLVLFFMASFSLYNQYPKMGSAMFLVATMLTLVGVYFISDKLSTSQFPTAKTIQGGKQGGKRMYACKPSGTEGITGWSFNSDSCHAIDIKGGAKVYPSFQYVSSGRDTMWDSITESIGKFASIDSSKNGVCTATENGSRYIGTAKGTKCVFVTESGNVTSAQDEGTMVQV